MWAGFFQWKHCFPNLSTANYFALNEYTTVGSNLRLPQSLRLLEGMIATAGLLAFAWSTGVLLTLAREFQAQQLQNYEQRRRERRTPPAPNPAARADGTKPGWKPIGSRAADSPLPHLVRSDRVGGPPGGLVEAQRLSR